MDIELSLKNMKGTAAAIASKSDAHRLLIAAALSDSPCRLILNSTSADIEATSACLINAGADIKKDGTDIIVNPIKNTEKEAVFDCGESGSTIRFLIPVASALGIKSIFTGSGRLPERPQTPILKALSENGASVSPDGEFPIKLDGKLRAGVFTLPGNVSSQFVTGLIFALPLLEGDSEIRLIPPVESKPYINMTVATVRKFSIEIEEKGNSYFVKGNHKYISPKEIKVDGDWSNGAFLAVCGALGDITVNGLFPDSLQGDKAIAEIIKKMGASVTQTQDSISVKADKLHGIEVDASDIPDLVPVISALAVFAEGTTTIKNAQRLRIKESDRLKTVTQLIKTAGGDITELPDGLVIKGGKKLKDSFTVDSFNDHRIVMAAAVLSYGSVVTVTNAQAINKSYPGFISDITKLGGVCNVINDR